MKKWISVLLCAVLLSVMLMPSVSAMDFNLIRNKNYKVPLLNAIANVQTVAGGDAEAVMTGENAPGLVLVNIAELTDVTAFMQLCIDNDIVPTFRAADLKEAQKVIDAVEKLACKDVTVISADPAVLKFVRSKKVVVRTGLELALEKDTATSEEAHVIRTTVRSAPATFCVMDAAVASRSLVAELQELAVAVWVKADENDVSVLRAVTSGANGVITANAFETAQLLNAVLEDNAMTRTPVMIGHRGNPTQAPENSLSGFVTAYENGADVFEIDVEITKDGEIIIMHDSSLNRTTNYTGNLSVNDMTLAEIKEYRLKGLDGKVSDEEVPTFREVLETFKDKDCRIFIEFKGYKQENVPAALALVKEYGMEDRVDVISFNSTFLTQTQKEIPGMSTGFLQAPSGATINEYAALETFYSSIINTQAANSTINPANGVISKQYLQVATNRGMTIWPWTYTKSTANMAFLMCPDGVTTDDVQWSKDMLKFIEADSDVTVMPGSAAELSVSGTTYGGAQSDIAAADRIVKVMEGEDVVSVENGVITALSSGTAQVLVGHRTKTAGGTDYVLYAQPVTITVSVFTPVMIAVIIAAAVVLVGAVIIVLVLRKPKK